jgi:hypothetical protein
MFMAMLIKIIYSNLFLGNAMKKIFLFFFALLFLASCGPWIKAPVIPPTGAFTYMTSPYSAESDGTIGDRMGESTCTGVLWLFSFGDCSIEAAAEDGNLKKINYVSYDLTNILGIYTGMTTKVYGE